MRFHCVADPSGHVYYRNLSFIILFSLDVLKRGNNFEDIQLHFQNKAETFNSIYFWLKYLLYLYALKGNIDSISSWEWMHDLCPSIFILRYYVLYLHFIALCLLTRTCLVAYSQLEYLHASNYSFVYLQLFICLFAAVCLLTAVYRYSSLCGAW